MEAPDKIKIIRFSDTSELSDYWVLENRTKNYDIEYIRNDVLLEWTKEKYKYYESLYSITNDPVNWGQRNMCQQLIDKLNSM